MALTSLLVSFIFATIFTPVVIKIAKARNWIVHPRKDRWHTKPTALMGGIAIFSAFVLNSFILGTLNSSSLSVFGAMSAMFILGLIDDFYEVKPIAKLIGQLICTFILLFEGYYFGNGILSWLGIPMTFFWVIGITNAINLLDNMDGLAAGISAIISGFSGIILFQNSDISNALIAFSLSGASLGFLVYNFYPAKIFMGDSGSLFLGFSVSYLTLALQKNTGTMNSFFVIVLPLILMAIPIMDTSLVTIKRIFAGRKVSQGGRDHTSHRLVALGLSEKKSVVILYLVAVFWGVMSLLIYRIDSSSALLLLLLITLFSLVFIFLLSSVKVYDESEEKLTYLRLRGQHLGNAFFLRFFLMNKKILAGLIADILIVCISFFWASKITNTEIGNEYAILEIFILVKIICFYIFNLYNRLWRYISTNEIFSQLISVVVATFAVFLILNLSKFKNEFGLSFFTVDFFITLSGIIFSRISYRVLSETITNLTSKKLKRVLIYGAGDAGNLLLKELLQNRKYGMYPVGWLDDDVSKKNMMLGGLRVFGGEESVAKAISKTKAEIVIISSNQIKDNHLQKIENELKSLDVEMRVFSIELKL